MSERDELCQLIRPDPNRWTINGFDTLQIADRILAAGWRKVPPAGDGPMVERVARAMYENECTRYCRPPTKEWAWSSLNHWQTDYWLSAARAAIAAMLEPSEAMEAAGWRACPPHDLDVRGMWTAMIDAALEKGRA